MEKLNFLGTGPKIAVIITSSITVFILFKINIKKEYIELEKFFGEEYLKYKNETPEFFPIQIKKWFR
jgi:protein-S-isoprenylcysteine O-methyltransferase Ste14